MGSGSIEDNNRNGLGWDQTDALSQEVQLSSKASLEFGLVSSPLGVLDVVNGQLSLKRDGAAIEFHESPVKKYREQESLNELEVEEPLVAIFSPGMVDSTMSRRKKRYGPKKKNTAEASAVVEVLGEPTTLARAAGLLLPPPPQ